MSKTLTTALVLFLVLSQTIAQTFSVKGVVLNSSTKETIPICNVYFSGSTIGTMTDADGNFTISNLRPGTYDLIVSHVNYDFRSLPITIKDKDINLGRIQLKEKPVETSYAEVKDKVDRKWRRQFSRFKRFAFGKHYREKDIEIPNAYVAEFEELNGGLIKKEPFALEIHNSYTGYEIYYPIEEFLLGKGIGQYLVGYPRFTLMESNDPNQVKKWENNRKKSYEGSLRHFLKSLLDQTLEANLFEIHLTNEDPQRVSDLDPGEVPYFKPIDAPDISDHLTIEGTQDSRIKKITFSDYIQIKYLKESNAQGQSQLTYLEANDGSIYVYTNGLLVNPQSVTAYGYLATEGLYEMLPFDFEYDIAEAEVFRASSSDSEYRFETIASTIEEHISQYPQEKVYLHMAKPYYAKGDQLWYKAYTLAGPNHIPTPLSQNLFVQLVDQSGKVVDQQTLYLENGVAQGSFTLSDSLNVGTYRIKGFTNWMRNFSDGYYFDESFKVIDPLKPDEPTSTGIQKSDIRFFPEGGDLVEGVTSKVAFEIVGAKTTGKIFDNEDKEVLTFEALHEGLGSFELRPEVGKSYYALLSGESQKRPLPEAKSTGFMIAVSDESDETSIVLEIKSTAPENSINRGYFLAHTRGIVGFAAEVSWNGPNGRLEIPKFNLADGIVHLTLFNADGQPEAERLVFKKSKDKAAEIQMSTNQESYVLRDSTSLKIKVKDLTGNPVKALLSLSAFDTDQINPSEQTQNIESNLLLSSDIDGGIKNSIKYLNASDSLSHQNLDLILLTKGWRRFLWKDIQAEQFPKVTFKEDRGISISGRTLTKNGRQSVPNATVRHLGNFEGLPTFAEATSTSKGQFRFEGLRYFEEASFLQTVTEKGKDNLQIVIDSISGLSPRMQHEPLEIISTSQDEVVEDSEDIDAFVQRSKERLSIDSAFNFDKVTDLGVVVVEGTGPDRSLASENIKRGTVFGRGQYSLRAADFMSNGQKFQNALFLLQGRVPGLTIILSGEGGEPIIDLNRKNERGPQEAPPETIYFIDDIPVGIAAITALRAEMIERVEVLKGMQAFQVYGEVGNGGVIAFYTKTAQEYQEFTQMLDEKINGTTLSKLLLSRGYYDSKEFYAPAYGVKLPEHVKPDYRDIIHWEPMIETDENGEATISFYNADLPTIVQVNVEGISYTGTPIVGSTTYTVKRK